MNTLKILVVGGDKSGKTSLVATMLDQLGRTLDKTDLQVQVDARVQSNLKQCIGQLQDCFGKYEISSGESLSGELDKDEIKLPLSLVGEDPEKTELALILKTSEISSERELADLIKEYQVIIIAVDTPALMEETSEALGIKEDVHERYNKPQVVTKAVEKVYGDGYGNEPRLFIFVPVKCEIYARDETEVSQREKTPILELRRAIRYKYHTLLDVLAYGKRSLTTAVVIAPVETLGGFYFSRIYNGSEFRFKKTEYESEYTPKYGEQPLQYILRFALRNLIRGTDLQIKNAIEQLKRDIGKTEIIQGHHLLDYEATQKPVRRKTHNLWLVGLLAATMAALLNVVIFEFANIFFNMFPTPADQVKALTELPTTHANTITLTVLHIIVASVLPALAATCLLAVLHRFIKSQRRSAIVFWILFAIVFLASFIPLAFLPPTIALEVKVVLGVMDLVIGVIVVSMLTVLSIEL